MVLFIITRSLSLLLLLQSYEVVAISNKIISKVETSNGQLTIEKLRHKTDSTVTSLPFHSRIPNSPKEIEKYSQTKRLLKMTNITRQKRGIGFPSLEASLLSLAFLTFAVYLVNLIQSIIKLMQSRQL